MKITFKQFIAESTVSRKEGDVVEVHTHTKGTDTGRYGKFNIAKITPTQIHVYDHNTKETMKFNAKTMRGLGEHDHMMIVKNIKEADEHTGRNAAADEMEYAWYIVRVKDDAVGAGPFSTLPQARSASERYQWYNENDYSIDFGACDDDNNFHDAPKDVPRTRGMK